MRLLRRPGWCLLPSARPSRSSLYQLQRHALLSTQNTHYSYMRANVLDDHNLAQVISQDAHAAFLKSREDGTRMPAAQEAELARSIMEWAMSKGAVNFAHWASPIRGPINLLKHDAFIGVNFATGLPLVKFSASRLFKNETDGSSFPNGGLRATHCAAAYLSWDRWSPPFIRGDTLYIPSGFISYHGDALDEKIPLLRSQGAVDRAGKRLLPLLGETEGNGVVCNVGWEQEFFLIDRDMFLERPDLVACGRTLIGAPPPRGQQTYANYFSRIAPRVKQILEAVQEELHALGVTLSVYHNEVAPAQHEFSPIFSMVNSSADTNIIAMEVLQDHAAQHDMAALFHEKPFSGLNGSGKHSNWGLNVKGTGRNLFLPGETVEHQRCFIAFVACMLRALHLNGDLVRIGVSSAGNDHRLGAQEAPPAIMSLYLGDNLGAHVERIIRGESDLQGYGEESMQLDFGTNAIAPISAGVEDRNRTAPFPFCGNRFELRAVGSEQHLGFPLALVQAIIADSMEYLADQIEGGKDVTTAVREMLTEHIDVMFNGDGYSDEWQNEIAPSRNLPNLRTSVEALEVFNQEKNKELLNRVGVFKPHEVEARQTILLEKYVETLLMEANCLLDMMNTGVLPACARDLALYDDTPWQEDRSDIYESLGSEVFELSELVNNRPEDATPLEQAKYCIEKIKPALQTVRELSDTAERKVEKDLWPYPTYHDILFTPQFEGRDEIVPVHRKYQ